MGTISDELVRADAHLKRVDPIMGRLIRRHGPCTLGLKRRDPFHVLCTSIISQQLSGKAADTIQKRVETLVGAKGRLRPEQLLSSAHADLRACGLSNAKAQWLRELARRVETGEFSFPQLRRMNDEAAIEALDALPGIGRWTAEMYLIFAMNRLDLFAMDDVGLRRSVNRIYNRGRSLNDARTRKLVATWAPYRSVASWYLWRVVDGDVESWV